MARLCRLAACEAWLEAASGQVIDESKLIDLTYPFNEKTVYWPNAKGFQHQRDMWKVALGGYWYAAGEFASAEHGGTHIDSPIHFGRGMTTLDNIPVHRKTSSPIRF